VGQRNRVRNNGTGTKTDKNNDDERERERQTMRCTDSWRKKERHSEQHKGSEKVRPEHEGGHAQ